MLMWYFVDGVLILKLSVPPTLTLIWVAKPWIVSSPIPSTCHFSGSTPGFEFSQATGFCTGTAQRPVSAAAAEVTPPPASVTKTKAARRRNADARAALNTRRYWLGAVITPNNGSRTAETCEVRRPRGPNKD